MNPMTKQKGSPRLFVTRNCVNLIRELHEYILKVMHARSSTLNQPEQPRKYNDHAVDALRYGIMSKPATPVQVAKVGSLEEKRQRVIKMIRAQEAEAEDPMGDFD